MATFLLFCKLPCALLHSTLIVWTKGMLQDEIDLTEKIPASCGSSKRVINVCAMFWVLLHTWGRVSVMTKLQNPHLLVLFMFGGVFFVKDDTVSAELRVF